MRNVIRGVEEFLFADGSPLNLAVTRILLAATALWVLLSRPGMTATLTFPTEMWTFVSNARRVRFLYGLPFPVEQILYFILHVTLVLVIIGVFPRIASFVSALLLYHFAPLETILWTPNPYLRGFTIPILGLLVAAFSRSGDALAIFKPKRSSESPGDYRWPLILIHLFFVQIYFFAGYSKLFASGFRWIEAGNISRYLLLLNQYLGFPRDSWGYLLAPHPLLCGAIAWTGMFFDLLFPIVLFYPRSRRVMIPLAIVFHIANAVLFRIMFQNVFLLLTFVDWAWVAARVRSLRPSAGRKLVAEF
jgi:hypothetical protein